MAPGSEGIGISNDPSPASTTSNRRRSRAARLLDTFVVAQLRAELPVAATRPRLYHLRQQQGRIEVDVLAELAGGGLIGIEVKATAAPGPGDARHLATLRDAEIDRFVAGIVQHTGPRALSLGDRIWAAPLSSLWGPAVPPR